MRTIIRRVRSKPREVRQRILFTIAFATFVGLLGLWMIMLDARSREARAIKEVKQGDSPFSILGDGVKEAVQSVTNKE